MLEKTKHSVGLQEGSLANFYWIESSDDFDMMMIDQEANESQKKYSLREAREINRLSEKLLKRIEDREKAKRLCNSTYVRT